MVVVLPVCLFLELLKKLGSQAVEIESFDSREFEARETCMINGKKNGNYRSLCISVLFHLQSEVPSDGWAFECYSLITGTW